MKVIAENIVLNKAFESVFKSDLLPINLNLDLLEKNELYSSSLRNYLLWDILHMEFTSSREEALLNKYYWLKLFYRQYRNKEGIDVGIEQLISNLIETIFNEFPNYDWQVLEKVNSDIDGGVKDVVV